MSQVKIYQEEKDVAKTASIGKYVEGEKVRAGKVLHVTHMSGSFDNVAATEYVELGYWNGHAYIPIKKGLPAVASDHVMWDGDLWLREEQRVYVYCADVATGEVMRLRANGRFE